MTTTLTKPEAQNVEFALEAHGVSFKLTITPVTNNTPEPVSLPKDIDKRVGGPPQTKETKRDLTMALAEGMATGAFLHPIPMDTPIAYDDVGEVSELDKKHDPSRSQRVKIEKILAKREAASVQSEPASQGAEPPKKKVVKRKAKKKAARKKKQ